MDLIKMRSLDPACLLVRPQPIEGESWGGFLLRLSAANGYRGIGDLGVILAMREIAIFNAMPQVILPQLGVQWQPAPIPSGSSQAARENKPKLSILGRSSMFKACPLCLMSDVEPYIRADWDGPISFVCQQHNVALISECQKCGKSLTYHQRSYARCDCGEHYRDQAPLPVLVWMNDLRRVFAEAFPKKPKTTFAGITELERDASMSCHWLVELPNPTIGRRISPLIRKAKSLAPSGIERLAPLLRNWPHNAIDSVRMEVNVDGLSRPNFLRRRLVATSFLQMDKLVKAVYHTLKLQKKILVEANNNTLINAGQLGFKLNDLQKLTGIQRSLLKNLCQSWRLIEAGPNGGNDTWLPSVEVSARIYWSIVQMYRETNDVRCSAAQVGCSETAIRGVISSGSIKSFALSAKIKDRRTYPVELAKLASYLFKVAKFKKAVFPSNDVYFSDWAKTSFFNLTAGRWLRILEAIQKGRVMVYKLVPQPITLDELYLTRQDQMRVLDQRNIYGVYISRAT